MANNCTTLAGITLDCRDNVGGIETVFIENIETSLAVTATAGVAAVADVLVDTVALDATLSSMDVYECVKQTGMLEETGTFSDENGTVFFTSVATAVFNKLDGAKLNELYELAVSAKLLVIVKDNNGKYWLVGNDRGAVATSSTEGTGTAYGDRNGISMSFTGIDNTPMVELTGATA